MKKVFIFLWLMSALASMAHAQIYARLAYQTAVPLAQMNVNIGRNAQGIAGELGLHLKNTPISFGWHWGIAGYGYRKNEELKVFAEGAQSRVFVETGHYYSQSQFFVNYDFGGRVLRPYLSAGVGSSHFRTVVAISAETSTPDCPKPAETSFASKDKAAHFMIGGGVRFELAPYLKLKEGTSFCLDLQIQHTRGGSLEYMTLRQDAASPSDAVPLYARFVSQARPDVVHQYYAANRYTSPIRLLSFQVGFSYRSSWAKD